MAAFIVAAAASTARRLSRKLRSRASPSLFPRGGQAPGRDSAATWRREWSGRPPIRSARKARGRKRSGQLPRTGESPGPARGRTKSKSALCATRNRLPPPVDPLQLCDGVNLWRRGARTAAAGLAIGRVVTNVIRVAVSSPTRLPVIRPAQRRSTCFPFGGASEASSKVPPPDYRRQSRASWEALLRDVFETNWPHAQRKSRRKVIPPSSTLNAQRRTYLRWLSRSSKGGPPIIRRQYSSTR